MASTDVFTNEQSDDVVAEHFMSRFNREILHERLVEGVKQASEGEFVIGRQSDTELTQIMRAVYIQHALHWPDRIAEQVRDLNDRVLRYAIPQIVSEVRMHRKYLLDRDQSRRADRPKTVLVSSAGQRQEVQAPVRSYFSPQ